MAKSCVFERMTGGASLAQEMVGWRGGGAWAWSGEETKLTQNHDTVAAGRLVVELSGCNGLARIGGEECFTEVIPRVELRRAAPLNVHEAVLRRGRGEYGDLEMVWRFDVAAARWCGGRAMEWRGVFS